jgi:hypothetical protein
MIHIERTDGGRDQDGFEYETRDCAVRAIAIAASIPYAHAHALLKAEGRKDRHGTKLLMSEKALIKTNAMVEGLHFIGTLSQLIQIYPRGRYYVTVRHHALALVDGVIHDQGSIAGPRSHVRRLYRVTPLVSILKPAVNTITQLQINELWARLDRLEAHLKSV